MKCGVKYLWGLLKSKIRKYINSSGLLHYLALDKYVVHVLNADSLLSPFLLFCVLAEGLYQSDCKRGDHAAVQSGSPHGAL